MSGCHPSVAPSQSPKREVCRGVTSTGLWGQARPQDRPKDEVESKHRAQWLPGVMGLGEPGQVLLVDTAGMLKAGRK